MSESLGLFLTGVFLFGGMFVIQWWSHNKHIVKAETLNKPDLAWYRVYMHHVDDFLAVLEGYEAKRFKETYVIDMPPERLKRLRDVWDCSWDKSLTYSELLDLMVISNWPYHIRTGDKQHDKATDVAYNHLRSTGKKEWHYTRDGSYEYVLKRTDMDV